MIDSMQNSYGRTESTVNPNVKFSIQKKLERTEEKRPSLRLAYIPFPSTILLLSIALCLILVIIR